jgi:hypothetical protein
MMSRKAHSAVSGQQSAKTGNVPATKKEDLLKADS